jgi:hypothetical protein
MKESAHLEEQCAGVVPFPGTQVQPGAAPQAAPFLILAQATPPHVPISKRKVIQPA